MDQSTRNQSILRKYIPEPAVPLISDWIFHFNFKLKIRKPRQTLYGDYRPPKPGLNHLITINRDMNQYGFLLTLVHEIAHLLTFERHGHRVKPHGTEWKEAFKELMRPVMRLNIFPEDVRLAIIAYMRDPGASSCSDTNLMRVLKKYDPANGLVLLESLSLHAHFEYSGRIFVKGAKIRTRYHCKERDSKHVYLFAGLAEVKSVHSTQ
jgi:SprT protein